MIGKVTYTRPDGRKATATLGTDLKWSCDDPDMARLVARPEFRPSGSPAYGQPGWAALATLEEYLGDRATVERTPVPPSPPGTIY